jgi:excisionase family DNA binding protein
MSDVITKDNERIVRFFKSLDRMLDDIETMVEAHKPALGGERYLTDLEVSEHLKISRRTLQDYRNEGRIPYYQLGGKILYRESDIQRLLDDAYRDAYR